MATNEKLIVDLEALRKLSATLIHEGDEIIKLLKSTEADVEALGGSWAGANHDRFNAYFEELYDGAMFFHTYVRSYGELMRDAAAIYEKLMDDVDARMSGALNGCH